MGAYRLLFNVSIEHTYFPDLSCKSLVFVPTHSSASLLNKTGLLLRPSKSRISIFCEENKMDILQLHAQDDFILTFKVFSKDPYFSSYTLPSAKNDNMVLCFSNQQITEDPEGKQRLHRDAYVSELDYQDMASAQLSDAFEPKDYLVKPCFVIQMRVTADAQGLCAKTLDEAERSFVIRYATNQTFWKYYILGDLAKRKIYIADLDNQIEFDELSDASLPGGHSGKVLQSLSAMPMQEMSGRRFQLRETGSIGDKVLIKRLPNACIRRTDGKVVSGEIEIISEIYIN